MVAFIQADQLLRQAHELGASDVHISAGAPPMFRIHGELKPMYDEPLTPQQTLDLVKQLAAQEHYEDFLVRGDYDGVYDGLDGVARCRVNAFRQRGHASLTIRLVPVKIPAVGELGLPSSVLEMTRKPQGWY